MDLYCAIDLIEGQAVRLVRGDFEQRREFGDPIELAGRYLAGGARWLHVVDLDAARTGVPVNREVVLAIASVVARGGASVQAGGGVRSLEQADALLAGGVDRIVIGTAAQRDPTLLPEICALHPGRVAVGLDHRGSGTDVAVSGWQEASGQSLRDALGRLADLPVAAVVVTSIERDGMLAGPDVEGLRDAIASTAHSVIASGGVRSAEDLRTLASLDVGGRRLLGAIVGMALVGGELEVEKAVAACAMSG